MTTRFEVPEPSVEAVVTVTHTVGGDTAPVRVALYAAYAVDLPAIVKAEVERALTEVDITTERVPEGFKYRLEVERYIAQRFGEGEALPPSSGPSPYPTCAHRLVFKPSGVCVNCGVQTGAFREIGETFLSEPPNPSAPAEPLKCDCSSQTDAPGSVHQLGCACVFTPEEAPPTYTPAERAFLRALAKSWLSITGPVRPNEPQNEDTCSKAARALLLEEAK